MAVAKNLAIFSSSLSPLRSKSGILRSLTWRSASGRAVLLAFALMLCMVYLCSTTILPRSSNNGFQSRPISHPIASHTDSRLQSSSRFDLGAWTPPVGTKVVALVFYGRRENVSILDCYLKRNLKSSGGILDEVIFAVRSDNQADLEYLDDLVQYPGYRKHVPTKEYEGYSGSWECVDDPSAIYIKIDDDVVYIEDTAFRAVAKRLVENPQLFAVSANVINNPALAWVHYHMGLYEPFWPDMTMPRNESMTSWRPSSLRPYNGPASGPDGFDRGGGTPAPSQGHNWLRVPYTKEAPYDISLTPASTLTYEAWGPSLKNWAAAAQTHYSFLTHLERGDTWRYHFDLWDYMYERISINFIGVRGRDIIDIFPIPRGDDEYYLTTKRPRELGRHVVVDGMGTVAHFSFSPQVHAHDDRAIAWTDILGRYRGYAEESGCPTVWNHLKYDNKDDK